MTDPGETRPGLKVLPLGVGDAFTAIHYTSCYALCSQETWLLVDCPHPVRKILRDGSTSAGLELDVGDLSAVVLTHLHADHSSGLEDLGFFSLLALGRPAPLVAHEDVTRRLWEKLRVTMESISMPELGYDYPPATLETYFDLTTFTEAAPVEVGPFRIEARKTLHPIPTTALRISAGGRTLGISSDTAFSRELVDWLGEADLVFHECGPGLHTPLTALEALPEELRAKIRITHYADDFDFGETSIPRVVQGELLDV
jgi:ribonuclease BN (tRNA processing enzyme)